MNAWNVRTGHGSSKVTLTVVGEKVSVKSPGSQSHLGQSTPLHSFHRKLISSARIVIGKLLPFSRDATYCSQWVKSVIYWKEYLIEIQCLNLLPAKWPWADCLILWTIVLHLWNEGIGLDALEIAFSSNTLGVILWQGSQRHSPQIKWWNACITGRDYISGQGQLAKGRDNKNPTSLCPTL